MNRKYCRIKKCTDAKMYDGAPGRKKRKPEITDYETVSTVMSQYHLSIGKPCRNKCSRKENNTYYDEQEFY